MRGDVCGGYRDRKVSGDFSFDNQNFPPGLLIGPGKKEKTDKIKAQVIGIMKKR